ncbi:MAG: DUF6293 family protein [Thermoplasmatota archaeon]
MAQVLMIATVGDEVDPVLIGVRDYPVRRLILLYTKDKEERAREIQQQVQPLRIDVELREIDAADVLMDTLRQVSEIHAAEAMEFTDVLLNVSSGEKMQTCSALSAAFVNGIPAIGVDHDTPFALPVLKFSYTELISDAKFRVLQALDRLDGVAESLTDLSKASGVEKSLLSYHLRTTREGKGLEDMGLVAIDRGSFGRLTIQLTEMGKLLLVGRKETPLAAPPV